MKTYVFIEGCVHLYSFNWFTFCLCSFIRCSFYSFFKLFLIITKQSFQFLKTYLCDFPMLLSTEPPVTFSKISEPLATHQVNLLRLWMQFAAFTCRYLLFDFSASCYTFFCSPLRRLPTAGGPIKNCQMHWSIYLNGRGLGSEAAGQRSQDSVCPGHVRRPVSQHPASWIFNGRPN